MAILNAGHQFALELSRRITGLLAITEYSASVSAETESRTSGEVVMKGKP